MFTLTAILGEVYNYFVPRDERKFWGWFDRQNKPSITVNKINSGSTIYILKQDPSVDVVEARMKWIRDEIKSGPKTDDIVIAGLTKTIYATDSKNNFLYHPNKFGEEFEALNVLGIVSNVLRMYKRTIKEQNQLSKFNWPWGKDPLQVYPSAGEKRNAYYSRNERALKFFKFRGDDGKMVHLARSFDVVAHETGHAMLDCIRPEWTSSYEPYTNALHESIGDLTVIFAILDDLDLCDSVVTHCKGNLHELSFLAIVAEEFGQAIGYGLGLRNVADDRTIKSVTSEMHDLSTVFTSAIYDILADLYDVELKKNDFEEPAIVLHTVGKALFSLLLQALLRSPREGTTYYDLAQLLLAFENDNSKWLIMHKYFEERQILDLWASKKHTEETFRETLKDHMKGECNVICGFNRRHLNQYGHED